jgi:hypothetical protein
MMKSHDNPIEIHIFGASMALKSYVVGSNPHLTWSNPFLFRCQNINKLSLDEGLVMVESLLEVMTAVQVGGIQWLGAKLLEFHGDVMGISMVDHLEMWLEPSFTRRISLIVKIMWMLLNLKNDGIEHHQHNL